MGYVALMPERLRLTVSPSNALGSLRALIPDGGLPKPSVFPQALLLCADAFWKRRFPIRSQFGVLGVDNWAWRKGQRYGTLLCDLESGRIVDLLPDCSAVSLEQWLRDHSGVEIISRDRASCYSEGSRQGAPDAIQVADRWHLLKNMGEALERLLYRYHQELKNACVSLQTGPEMNASTSQEQEISRKTRSLDAPDVPAREPSQAQQNSRRRREARKERYDQVLELRQQGRTLRAIARETGLSRATMPMGIRYRIILEAP